MGSISKDSPKVVLYYPKQQQSRLRVPLSLVAISTFLARENFNIVIIDGGLYAEPAKEVMREIENALCLGISSLTGSPIKDGLKIAKLVKERYPGLPIVWGGWHPTIEPETTIQSPYVDIVVRGQGERTFAELVHTLVDGKPLDNILGIYYKSDGEVFRNPGRPFEDINNFPSYPYHLVDVERVLESNEFGSRSVDYVSSYGCPYRCAFCAEISVHERKWKALNPYRVAEEVNKLVKDYDVDTILLLDASFFIDKERARIFCEELIRRRLKINWFGVGARISQALQWEDEFWELIVKAGCCQLSMGAESGYQPALDLMQKDLLVEDIIAFTEKVRRFDINVFYSMLCGLPWDSDYRKTRELTNLEIKLDLDLAHKLVYLNKKSRFMLYLYTPYPGNPLYQRSLEIGLKAPQNLEGWGNWVFYTKMTPWVTRSQARFVLRTVGYIEALLNYPHAKDEINPSFYHRVASFFPRKFTQLFELIVKTRWKYKFLAFPLDAWLFHLMIRLLAIPRSGKSSKM